MNVKIVTDSGCDLSKDHYNEFDIEMIPLSVHLDGEQYEDGKTIDPAQVYQAMKDGQSPKTSQVSLQAFQDVFLAYAEMKQPLLYIAFSSELSGTYQAAKLAEQEVKETYPEAAIYVLDSKCASLGHGLVVLHAAKLAKSGAPLEEIVKEASDQAEHMEHIFTVDHLEYL